MKALINEEMEPIINSIKRDIEHSKKSRHLMLNQLTKMFGVFDAYREDLQALTDLKIDISSLKKNDEHTEKNISRIDSTVSWMLKTSLVTMAGIIINIFITYLK